jgi:hypothetical protein
MASRQPRKVHAEFKRKVFAEAGRVKRSGEMGVVLRRNGLYSSHLVKWRASALGECCKG